jgi:hypothetical protein
MNLRKGFLRLTLVLSILVGIMSSFPVLEHTIENEHGIVRKCLPYELQIRIRNEQKDRAMEGYGRKIAYPWEFEEVRKLALKTHKSFGPDYILYWWRHLAVLTLPGFFTVWFIYGLTGWIIIPFIVRGFHSSSKKGAEPYQP